MTKKATRASTRDLLQRRLRNQHLSPARDPRAFESGPRPDIFAHTVLIAGRVAGTWKRTVRRGAVQVNVFRRGRWTAADMRSVETAARRYAAFMGLTAVVTVSSCS